MMNVFYWLFGQTNSAPLTPPNTFFTSFMKDGGLCLSDLPFISFCVPKLEQTPIDLETRLTAKLSHYHHLKH